MSHSRAVKIQNTKTVTCTQKWKGKHTYFIYVCYLFYLCLGFYKMWDFFVVCLISRCLEIHKYEDSNVYAKIKRKTYLFYFTFVDISSICVLGFYRIYYFFVICLILRGGKIYKYKYSNVSLRWKGKHIYSIYVCYLFYLRFRILQNVYFLWCMWSKNTKMHREGRQRLKRKRRERERI